MSLANGLSVPFSGLFPVPFLMLLNRLSGLRAARPRPRPGRARAGGAVARRGAAAGQRGLALPGVGGLAQGGEGRSAARRQEDEDTRGERLSGGCGPRWVSASVGFEYQ